ncbi:MAG: hypothetical protein JRG96_21405 [Deltaproteobacteria bacterium]|nr:hypothetical protein [Deltaproteobacteria bacterium]
MTPGSAHSFANAPAYRATRGAVGVLCVLALALPAAAFIPKAKRVVAEVAKVNAASKRATALRFELSMRMGDGEPLARGELITHPTGLARLELRGARGLVERHLLQGSEHSTARDGELVESPRAFLPPLFLLQADSAAVLDAALSSVGVREGVVGLAPCGENECFMLGRPPGESRGASLEAALAEGLTPGFEDPEELSPALPTASVWVDVESFEIREMSSSSGVRVLLGPTASYDSLRVPRWWVIAEPGKRPVRFEVHTVMPVNAPASVFSRSWLMAPVLPAEGDAPPEAPAP